jgi:hypothetical protein
MTAEQERVFDERGCVCRALIALANSKGEGLTKQRFIDTYAPRLWPNPTDPCGSLKGRQLKQVLEDLGLGREWRITCDFWVVRDAIESKLLSGLFLMTEKWFGDDGILSAGGHCVLMSETEFFDGDFVYFWELDLEHGHHIRASLPEDYILALQPSFLMLFP